MSNDGKVRFDLKQVAQMDRQIHQQKSQLKQHKNSKIDVDQPQSFVNVKKEKKGPNLFDLIQQEEAENDDVVGIQSSKRHRAAASNQQTSFADIPSVPSTKNLEQTDETLLEDNEDEMQEEVVDMFQTHTKQGFQLRKLLFPESFQSETNIDGIGGEDNVTNSAMLRQTLARTIFIFDPVTQEKQQNRSSIPALRTVVLSNRSTFSHSSVSGKSSILAIPSRLSVSETFPLPLLQRFKNLDINALAEQQRQVREKQRLLLLEKERKEKEAAERKKAEEKNIPKIDSIYDDEDVSSTPYELFSRTAVLKAVTKDDGNQSTKENKISAEWILHPKYVPIVTFSDEKQSSTDSINHLSKSLTVAAVAPLTVAESKIDVNRKENGQFNNSNLHQQNTDVSPSETMTATILKFVRPLRPLPILKSADTSRTDINNTESVMTVDESWLHRMDPILRIIRNAQQERQQLLLAVPDNKVGAVNRKVSNQAGIVGAQSILSALSTANKNFSKENVIHRDIFGVSNDIRQAEEQERKAKRAKAKQGETFGIDTKKTSFEKYLDFDSGGKDTKGEGGDDEEDDEENGLLSSNMHILGKDAVLVYGGDDSDMDDDGSDYGGGKRKLGSTGARGGNGGKKRMKTG